MRLPYLLCLPWLRLLPQLPCWLPLLSLLGPLGLLLLFWQLLLGLLLLSGQLPLGLLLLFWQLLLGLLLLFWQSLLGLLLVPWQPLGLLLLLLQLGSLPQLLRLRWQLLPLCLRPPTLLPSLLACRQLVL